METIRGGRSGLHNELRKYIPDGEGVNFDDPVLFVDIHIRPVLSNRRILKELSKGHDPVSVGIIVSPETIAQRKRYQLERARALYGTSEMTPIWKRYYLKHLKEISALN